MTYRGRITDAFSLGGRSVLQLTEVRGRPRPGLPLMVGSHPARIVEVGRNSTDGQAVSTRACLTGRPVAPYGAIAIAFEGVPPAMSGLRDVWVEET